MNRIRGKRNQIQFVRLFDDDAYFISDDERTKWEGLNRPDLTKNLHQNGVICIVALAPDGSLVVVRENRFTASTGVFPRRTQRLASFIRNIINAFDKCRKNRNGSPGNKQRPPSVNENQVSHTQQRPQWRLRARQLLPGKQEP
jgi:hypothetical protein